MSKQSIAFRLSIYISSAIILVLLTLTLVVYRDSLGLVRENIEKNAISMSSDIITQIRDKVISSEELAKNTAGQLSYFVKQKDIELLLTSLISNYPFVAAIYIDLDEKVMDGDFLHYSVTRENSKIRFKESKEQAPGSETNSDAVKSITSTGKEGWTEPFKKQDGDEAAAMYCYPVIISGNGEANKKAGYIQVELSLSFLNHEIKDMKIGKSGFSFLVSNKGTYLTHPRDELILTENLNDLSDSLGSDEIKILLSALAKGRSGSFIAHAGMLGRKKSWVYYTPIPENKWMLIFVVPYSQLFRDLWTLLYKLILVSVAGIALIFFLVTYISRRLMNPLAQIAGEIHEFSTAGRVKVSRNEVEALEKSFNLMQTWYNKFKEEQKISQLSSRQIKNDMEQASEVIHNIIPEETPVFSGKDKLEIFSAFKPANIIGGDLYDYFLIDEDHVLITIGDVSGKGIPGAVFVGVAHTLLRNSATDISARNIVKKLNRELFSKNHNQYFLTLFVGVIELSTGLLNYCNAAHTTSFLLKENGTLSEVNGTHGLPLGLYNDREYSGSQTELAANDMLILYTDGVTETINKDGLHFGEKRLKKELISLKGNTPAEIVSSIEGSLKNFRGSLSQIDDYSIVVIKYVPA